MENCAQFWGAQSKKDEEERDRSRGGVEAESGSQGICPMEGAGLVSLSREGAERGTARDPQPKMMEPSPSGWCQVIKQSKGHKLPSRSFRLDLTKSFFPRKNSPRLPVRGESLCLDRQSCNCSSEYLG